MTGAGIAEPKGGVPDSPRAEAGAHREQPEAAMARSCVAVILVAALAVAGCGGGSGEAAQLDQAGAAPAESFVRLVNVEVQTLAPRAFTRMVQVTGVAIAMRDVTVSAEEAGVVRRVVRDRGDVVDEGQAIVHLDDAILAAQVRAASAQARYAEDVWDRRRALYEEDGVGSELTYLQAQNDLEQSRSTLEALRERIARTTVAAPIRGVLNDRFVEIGSLVAPGTPVARIVQTDTIRMTAGAPERFAAGIGVGSMATVTFDVLGARRFEAEVSFVGAVVDPENRTFPLELTLPNPDRLIKPGMIASVEIVREEIPDALVVPRQALVAVERGEVVFVIQGTGAEARAAANEVEVLAAQGNEVVIGSGLAAGDRIVVVGQQSVTAGDRVRIVANMEDAPERSER